MGRMSLAMSEEQTNLVLEHLRAIRSDLAGLKADMQELKERTGHLEGLYGTLSQRVDRIGGDLAMVTRRMDAHEAFVPEA